MKIRSKVFLSLTGLLTLLLVVILATYYSSRSVDYYRNRTALLEEQLVAMTGLRAQVRNQVLETYEVGFVEDFKSHLIDINQQKALVQKRFKALEPLVKNEKSPLFMQTLLYEYKLLDKNLDIVILLIGEKKFNAAKKLLLQTRDLNFEHGFNWKTTLFIDDQTIMTRESSIELKRSIKHLQNLLLIFFVFAVVMAAIIMFAISKDIGNRLSQLEVAAKKIALGDFDIDVTPQGSDEIFALAKSFKQMAASLFEAKNTLIKQQEIITHSSKMSALGQMAGGIAHEINTPLAAIILNAEMIALQNSELSEPDPEIRKRAKLIGDIGNRIAKIILALKGFSRDAKEDDKEFISVRDIISKATSLCAEKFKNHGIQLLVDDEMIDTIIYGRVIQLSQVVLNLLNNSYDAVAKLDDKWIQLKATVNEKNIELRVIDSGYGLSSEIVEKIFEPFFTTKDIGKGTGLGLSISKSIIKQHNGNIFYEKLNPNTCFVIQLPIAAKKEN